MADDKLADIAASGADCLVGTDVPCLLHLQGRIRRQGKPIRVMHLAQLLEEATRPWQPAGREGELVRGGTR